MFINWEEKLLNEAIESSPLKKVIKWIQNYTNFSKEKKGKYKSPSDDVIEFMSQWTLNKPYMVYRGMGWEKDKVDKIVKEYFHGESLKLKDEIKFSNPNLSSWSADKKQAFAFANGDFTLVIQSQINPKQVLLDTINMSKENEKLGQLILYKNEKEIILKPGNINAQVVDLTQWNGFVHKHVNKWDITLKK